MPAVARKSKDAFAIDDSSRADLTGLREALSGFLKGKESVAEVILCSLLAAGHLLFEDVPGVGKTTLIKALAKMLGLQMSRIQCTSDLLPSDILGVEVFSEGSDEFVLHPGPIFANLVFVDELNRASPRTQSALLEAMAEGIVTINRKTYPLPKPFLVFACQNPSDYLGTYSLPESQLDRFAAKISLSYPVGEREREIFALSSLEPLNRVPESLINGITLAKFQRAAEAVTIAPRVIDYAQRIIDKSRAHDGLKLGISTRGGVTWLRMARARALLAERDYVIPDDLQALAKPCLAHRVMVRSGSQETSLVLDSILESIDIG